MIKIQEAIEMIADLRKKLCTLKAHMRQIQVELVEASQYDRNYEKFADALFDLLGEESSEAQFKKLEQS